MNSMKYLQISLPNVIFFPRYEHKTHLRLGGFGSQRKWLLCCRVVRGHKLIFEKGREKIIKFGFSLINLFYFFLLKFYIDILTFIVIIFFFYDKILIVCF